MKRTLNNKDWPMVKKLLLKKEKVYRSDVVKALRMDVSLGSIAKMKTWSDAKLLKRTGVRGSYAYRLTAKGRKTDEL